MNLSKYRQRNGYGKRVRWSQKTTAEIIAEIRAAEAEATPQPWVVESYESEIGGEYITGHITSPHHTYCGNLVQRRDSVLDSPSLAAGDAKFVVLMRTHILALCDSHERLKTALENLTKEFIHCRKFYGPDSRTPTGREYDETIEAAREALNP